MVINGNQWQFWPDSVGVSAIKTLPEQTLSTYLKILGNNLQDIVMELFHGDGREVSQLDQRTQNSQNRFLGGLRTVL